MFSFALLGNRYNFTLKFYCKKNPTSIDWVQYLNKYSFKNLCYLSVYNWFLLGLNECSIFFKLRINSNIGSTPNWALILHSIIRIRYCVIIYFGNFWPPNFSPIPDLYAKFLALHVDICVSSSTVPETYVVSVWWPRIACELCTIEVGGGEVMQVEKYFKWMCVQNSSGLWFTALSWVLILGPSLVPGPAEDWETISVDHVGVKPCNKY